MKILGIRPNITVHYFTVLRADGSLKYCTIYPEKLMYTTTDKINMNISIVFWSEFNTKMTIKAMVN